MTGSARLLDVNVLVPLLWPPHARHGEVQDWFGRVREGGFATCPIVQLGAVRVLAMPAISQGTLTIEVASQRLMTILAEPHHEFWPDSIAVTDRRFQESLPHAQGHNQLTDRYLLVLAAAHGGRLATLDRSMLAGLPAGSPLLDHLEVVAG